MAMISPFTQTDFPAAQQYFKVHLAVSGYYPRNRPPTEANDCPGRVYLQPFGTQGTPLPSP